MDILTISKFSLIIYFALEYLELLIYTELARFFTTLYEFGFKP